MLLFRLVLLQVIIAPGLGIGVIPINFLPLPSSKSNYRKNNPKSNVNDQISTISVKDRSLISALDSLGSKLIPKINQNGNFSTSLFLPSLFPGRNIHPVIVSRSKVNKHLGKYGTTRNLKQLFIGRCYEYQYRKDIKKEKEWDCNALWELFFNAFAFKGPCDVTSKDYQIFLDAIDEPVEKDKGLLWSGTRELAHKYSDFYYTKKYITLEDTLAGYMLSGLTWCGDPNLGMNFKECPWSCSLQSPYWSLANTRFAEKLHGVVHMILNGTRMHLNDGRIYPTFMQDRYYLGPNAVPNLKSNKIEKIIIIVAHTLRLEPLEFCGKKSVRVLESELKKRGIPVECHDDPKVSRYIFCASDPEAKECTSLESADRAHPNSSKNIDVLSPSDNTFMSQILAYLPSTNFLSPPARL